jgi:hypothetical protein
LVDRQWVSWGEAGHPGFLEPHPVADTVIFRVARLLDRWGNRSKAWRIAGFLFVVAGGTAVCAWQGWGFWEGFW